MTQKDIKTPYYIVYEDKLVRNLQLLKRVETEAGVKIIMAFKANSLWKTFPIIKRYFSSSTASSLNEMRLSLDFLGDDVHAYCPVYTDATFPQFLAVAPTSRSIQSHSMSGSDRSLRNGMKRIRDRGSVQAFVSIPTAVSLRQISIIHVCLAQGLANLPGSCEWSSGRFGGIAFPCALRVRQS